VVNDIGVVIVVDVVATSHLAQSLHPPTISLYHHFHPFLSIFSEALEELNMLCDIKPASLTQLLSWYVGHYSRISTTK
jgi:hypothetical protein